MEGYVFLDEYTADVAFIAYGKTLEEVFINAAKALMEIQTDLAKIEPRECIDVEIEGFDKEHLLKKWLEELLYYRDVKQMFFSKFDIRIEVQRESGEELYRLRGKICGECFDPDKHTSKVEVKAVSYHDMEIGRHNDKLYARVLVDI